MNQETLEIKQARKVIQAQNACFDNSSFKCVGAEKMSFDDVSLAGTSFHNVNLSGIKISDANLSDLTIVGAQWGGAQFLDIGFMNGNDPSASSNPKTEGLTINGMPID